MTQSTRRFVEQAKSSTLLKYLFVGGLAFIAEYVSFIVMYRGYSINYIVANAVSFGIGLLTSFLLNRIWTFATASYHRAAHHQFAFYTTLAICNLGATIGLVSLFKAVGITPNFGKLWAMAITSSWNFLIFKRFIFKHKPRTET